MPPTDKPKLKVSSFLPSQISQKSWNCFSRVLLTARGFRRSHQYESLSIEKTRIVTPGNLIRAFAATYLLEPHATTRNYRRLTDQIGKDIFGEGHKLDPYYVAAFALYKLEYLFRNQLIDAVYKAARYQILLAARLLANPTPLPRMNSHEMERHCKVINDILWDAAKSDDLFARAAKIVNDVAQGNFGSDNIRVLPFTEKVIAQCNAPAP
jgi:hypothetical protein